ncbi:MAG: hypoxanthine phosphoribosyltransferase [Limnochordia bacterium]|jgi:hypoxanthine phosphoribosyltransferase|nr:hypoxanthine phosphoribosyltransferase [Limnochordia bacterium]MDI9465781.1 hypoxanthine phosphoribosyltransferase [Bacillota bacterium]NLO96099.1 hypoxanthine phosphoribosyltransferase [Bacillota bacterium]HAI52858.1 hypoxanthine phosphoribosyltransferase [Bacillota bacterium]HAN94913.1 hypoxanthine phosphoribosyltransferase [Bacillota bacterium]
MRLQLKVLISAEDIARRVQELGREITADYQGRSLMIIGILKGAVVFMSDLIRQISVPLEVDFMAISSYGEATETSGVVQLLKDLDRPIEGKHVLIVEDIIDTGLTLSYLYQLLQSRNPATLKTAVLLDKPERRRTDFTPDYVGFTIPDKFVIGYGLDYNHMHRELPYVGVLEN